MGQWAPTSVEEIYEVINTSTRPLHVETDAGAAFVKLADSESGPHALACDLIGTKLAHWLGAPTFDLHVLRHGDFSLIDEIKGQRKVRRAEAPSLASRKVSGQTWGGDEEQLEATENPDVVAALVVLDTWTRNHDRYEPREPEPHHNHRNVFFADGDAPGRVQLIAMDFTECIKCGRSELSKPCFTIERVKDERIFGLFPEFKRWMTTEGVKALAAKLETFTRNDASEILSTVPREWSMTDELRGRCAGFLYERAGFVAPILEKMIGEACGW
ncbi:MAG: hypothetical protein KIT84_02935 [Labilithrix sp.]|nr:hypothetical protein [Labilithrix sp.]MCW5809937.1 hypothetical protein [Labilithrix sp.]